MTRMDEERIVTNTVTNEDYENEITLRPKWLS